MQTRVCAVLLAPVWAIALALAHPARPSAAELRGTPRVIDGDTVEVQGRTVRLFGIDAPELGQTCTIEGRAYDCGMVARTALLDLTAGAVVTCSLLPAQEAGNDGRPGRCFADGYDLSEGMVYTGWALAARSVSTRYAGFEEGARAARRGLWKGRFVAPWEWRRGERLPEDPGAP